MSYKLKEKNLDYKDNINFWQSAKEQEIDTADQEGDTREDIICRADQLR